MEMFCYEEVKNMEEGKLEYICASTVASGDYYEFKIHTKYGTKEYRVSQANLFEFLLTVFDSPFKVTKTTTYNVLKNKKGKDNKRG